MSRFCPPAYLLLGLPHTLILYLSLGWPGLLLGALASELLEQLRSGGLWVEVLGESGLALLLGYLLGGPAGALAYGSVVFLTGRSLEASIGLSCSLLLWLLWGAPALLIFPLVLLGLVVGVRRKDLFTSQPAIDERQHARLLSHTRELAARIGVKHPRVDVSRIHGGAAMHLLGQPRLQISPRYSQLAEGELRALLAHELTHCRHLCSAYALCGWLWCGEILAFACACLSASASGALLWGVAGLPFLLWLALQAWSRRMEYQCDLEAAGQVSPRAISSSLRFLLAQQHAPGALNEALHCLRDSHPTVTRRLARLQRVERAQAYSGPAVPVLDAIR